MRLHGLVLLGALVAACGSEDVLVFETLPGDGGTSGDLTSSVGGSSSSMTATETSTTATTTTTATSTTGMPSEPCGDVYDCGNSFFCQKESCSAQMGACEPRPVFASPDPEPVCGCDGVTYWNDDMRRQFGVASSTAGECSGYARRCNYGTDCGDFPAYCAHILPPGRGCDPEPYPPPEGTCWVIPPRPEMVTDSNIFLLCAGSGIPEPDSCADTHLAIWSQLPHIRISEAADCPNGLTRPPPPEQ